MRPFSIRFAATGRRAWRLLGVLAIASAGATACAEPDFRQFVSQPVVTPGVRIDLQSLEWDPYAERVLGSSNHSSRRGLRAVFVVSNQGPLALEMHPVEIAVRPPILSASRRAYQGRYLPVGQDTTYRGLIGDAVERRRYRTVPIAPGAALACEIEFPIGYWSQTTDSRPGQLEFANSFSVNGQPIVVPPMPLLLVDPRAAQSTVAAAPTPATQTTAAAPPR